MAFPDHNESWPGECQPFFSALNAFLQKLTNDEWLTDSSKEEIKSCLRSGKKIETMLETLEVNGCLESLLPLTVIPSAFDIDQLKKVTDVILAIILTAPGVSLICVRTGIEEYFKLCGLERFEHVLSTVIFCSEIYRVLLDFFASSDCSLEQGEINLQSNLFSRIWKTETDVEKMKRLFSAWLKTDSSGCNFAVALMVIIFEDNNSCICLSLIHILTKILCERGCMALVFWKIFTKLPETRRALEKSSELMSSVLLFLRTTTQWMEATANFSWISTEKGPCVAFGFNDLVVAVKSLIETEGSVSEKTKQFLFKRRNSIGCTLWDDVEMKLNSF